jgi:phosphatidylglycerol:prolipoprotein diacylglycerol transferase
MRKKVPIRVGMDIIAPCLMIGLGFGRIGCYLNGCCYGAECNVSWAPGVEFPYYSNAYIDEFEKNELRRPIARDLLVPGTPLTDYLDSTHQDALQEPVPDAMARYLRGAYLKSRPEAGRLAEADLSNRLHPAQLYSAFTGFLLAAFLLAYFTLPHAPGRVFALMMISEGTCRFLLEIIRAEPPLRIGADFVARFHGIDFSLGMIEAIGIIAAGAILWFIFGAAVGTGPPTIQSESRMAIASPVKNRSESPTVIA